MNNTNSIQIFAILSVMLATSHGQESVDLNISRDKTRPGYTIDSYRREKVLDIEVDPQQTDSSTRLRNRLALALATLEEYRVPKRKDFNKDSQRTWTSSKGAHVKATMVHVNHVAELITLSYKRPVKDKPGVRKTVTRDVPFSSLSVQDQLYALEYSIDAIEEHLEKEQRQKRARVLSYRKRQSNLMRTRQKQQQERNQIQRSYQEGLQRLRPR